MRKLKDLISGALLLLLIATLNVLIVDCLDWEAQRAEARAHVVPAVYVVDAK